MACQTIWKWILNNGWPLSMDTNVAIQYFHENLSDSAKILTHKEISMLANEVNQFVCIYFTLFFLLDLSTNFEIKDL